MARAPPPPTFVTRAAMLLAMVYAFPAQSARAIPCHGQNLPVCTFQNDYAGFQAAMAAIGAAIRRIDFETLPDGGPSQAGIFITPTFNYTQQGVTFSAAAAPYPYIEGSRPGTFGLAALSSAGFRDWIVADLTAPNRAVGVFDPGDGTLRAYDAQGSLIGSVSSPTRGFLGIVSDAGIARGVADRGDFGAGIDDFVFSPIVPEPCTAALILFAAPLLLPRRRAIARPTST